MNENYCRRQVLFKTSGDSVKKKLTSQNLSFSCRNKYTIFMLFYVFLLVGKNNMKTWNYLSFLMKWTEKCWLSNFSHKSKIPLAHIFPDSSFFPSVVTGQYPTSSRVLHSWTHSLGNTTTLKLFVKSLFCHISAGFLCQNYMCPDA